MQKIIFILLFIFTGFIACKQNQDKNSILSVQNCITVIKKEYELYKPTTEINGVLVLFGGYPEVAEDIKREFNILDLALENRVAVIFSNYNQKLWMDDSDKHQLATIIQDIFTTNALPTDNIYIGGFSSGGNVSLLLSNYIKGKKQNYIKPKGVFIVDSPIDLSALYLSSKINIERNFSEVSFNESTWLIELLENNIGNPEHNIKEFEDNSIYTHSTKNTSNLNNLKSTKIRMYSEPDTTWWKDNRMIDYTQMNAYYIKALFEILRTKGFKNADFITTKNKGYRANGDRHPHSWSIVDKQNLMLWILNK